MRSFNYLYLGATLLLSLFSPAAMSICPDCCKHMGGVQYCDNSAGRYVCNNGYYSTCYCSRHAVMELEYLSGCCMWHNGVMAEEVGLVICNDGSISEMCSLQYVKKQVSVF